MNIDIIGAAEMGSCLASKLVKLGHTVSIANSRGPFSLKQLREVIGAKAVTVEEVVKDKDVIIVSIPTKNVQHIPKTLFENLPKDVVVIDTMNYYPVLRDGVIPALDNSNIDSLWVEQQLSIPVIKVFNSILATSIKDKGRPKGDRDRIALAVSGDNHKAKEIVFQLVDELGFDPFDLGTIVQSWKQQPGTSIYCRDINFGEIKKRVGDMGTDWPAIRDVLVAKRKADEALIKVDYPGYLKSLQN